MLGVTDSSRPTELAETEMLDRRLAVPDHVVYRAFAEQVVLLNLDTGKYHGLNPTGGAMLDALGRAEDVRGAAAIVAAELDHPQAEVEQDFAGLCEQLLDRGLLEPR